MFENIGKKIKTLAMVICWIGIVASVIIGFIIGALDDAGLIGFFVIFIGGFSSWIGSFFTYGFGELIDKTTTIANFLQQDNDYKSNHHNSHRTDYIEDDIIEKTTRNISLNTVNDNLNNEQQDKLKELEDVKIQYKSGKITKEDYEYIVRNILLTSDNKIACPVCEKKQPLNRNVCFYCGMIFIDEN